MQKNEKTFSQIFKAPVSNEEVIRSNIVSWLNTICTNVKPEHKTREGPADIYLPNRRIIIETKQRGKAEPNNPNYGSRPGETPLQQLTRYVLAERASEQRILNADERANNLAWVGIITDGREWYIYEYDVKNNLPVEIDRFTLLAASDSFEKRQSQLEKMITERNVGREWVPADPVFIFEKHLESLRGIYQKYKAARDTKTQQTLWARQLDISGSRPSPEHEEELFILHTLLIAGCTIISNSLLSQQHRHKEKNDLGFASWVRKDALWLESFERDLTAYNWKATHGDVLRTAYMSLISIKDRHIYGEYYTPDWLAEKICQDIITDDVIEKMILDKDDTNILDPACGSGIFLYAACAHILNSRPVRDNVQTDEELTEMLSRHLYGIDIHPVAVAMTRTNLLRALPAAAPSNNMQLHVYQADSLQTARAEYQQKLSELSNIFTIKSRDGIDLRLPMAFVNSADFAADIKKFTRAAVADYEKIPHLAATQTLEKEDITLLERAYQTMRDICRTEGNDVWAWYMINQTAMFKLCNKMSCIISNPPWVRMSTIQNVSRKTEFEKMAKNLGLWAGGKNATGFNIAAVFVKRCRQLYGKKLKHRAAFVLPQSALTGGGNWDVYRREYLEKTQMPIEYDLDTLAFPENSKSCVHLFGLGKAKIRRLKLKSGCKLENHNHWNADVESKTFLEKVAKYTKAKSEWFVGKRPMARQGAIITPSCLIILNDGYIEKYSNVDGKKNNNEIILNGSTKRSIHGVWKNKTYDVEIPKKYTVPCLFNKGGLFPFCIGKTRRIIAPLDSNGNFINNVGGRWWWQEACDIYAANCGKGKTTPKTLSAQLDFMGKLKNQFPLDGTGSMIVYNTSGSNLYAARIKHKVIIDSSLYCVNCKTVDEAFFLIAILNADCIVGRFKQAKKTDRHFHTYFWHEVPIPRYDANNNLHQQLATLGQQAEKTAYGMENPTYKNIKQTLRDTGIAAQIDSCVKQIII